MRGLKSYWQLAKAVAWRAVGISFVGMMGAYALFGANGVLAWNDYAQRLDARKAQLSVLKAEQAAIANRVQLLNPDHANPDLVDELVRRDLGLAQSDEVIIPLR
jgi:cell division protein FtsB